MADLTEMRRRFLAMMDGVVGQSTSAVDLEAFRVANEVSHAEAIELIAGLLASGAIVSSTDWRTPGGRVLATGVFARWIDQGK